MHIMETCGTISQSGCFLLFAAQSFYWKDEFLLNYTEEDTLSEAQGRGRGEKEGRGILKSFRVVVNTNLKFSLLRSSVGFVL